MTTTRIEKKESVEQSLVITDRKELTHKRWDSSMQLSGSTFEQELTYNISSCGSSSRER